MRAVEGRTVPLASLNQPAAGCDRVTVRGAEMAVFEPWSDSPADAPLLVWAHGWGQSHSALLLLAETQHRAARSLLLDLPGFGASPPPPAAWSTSDYADATAEWLAAAAPAPSPVSGGGPGWRAGTSEIAADGLLHYPHPNPPPLAGEGKARRIWIGYSFGCRVGLQLAARHPELVDGLFLIAAPGLPRQRSPLQQARFLARRWAFRTARRLTPEGPARDRLRARLGSADYRNATPLLRQILVKAVSENLGAAASAVRCPTMLVYGDRDDDASPDIGERFHRMIPHSRFVLLRGFGHLDIVGDGRHQIAQLLTNFLANVSA